MEEDNLYDEFGNYIGPEIGGSEGSDSDAEESPHEAQSSNYAYEKLVSSQNLG